MSHPDVPAVGDSAESSESVDAAPVGTLTCQVRVANADEETK
ncbi:hypothetical protein [Nocardia sp. BMG111209]|nr:hypothetical protein [Nocardia sp. BMG111209]